MSRTKRPKRRADSAPPVVSRVETTDRDRERVRLPTRGWPVIVLSILALGAIAAAAHWWTGRGASPPTADLRAGIADTRPSAPPSAPTSAPPAQQASASGPAHPVAWSDNVECLSCHAEQAEDWRASHHAMAMAVPSPASVRGDFDDTEFTHAGVTSRFFRREERYFVRTEGPDGQVDDFEIAWTFGVWPLQQYLIAQPGGRLQALQIAWDDERKRWFHLLPDEETPPGDVLHWTGRYQTANTLCITCHTTGFEKRYDAAADTFASQWAEPNVSCQACHGPGARHVAWARAAATGQNPPDTSGTHFGLTVDAAALAGKRQVEICAACHSRRSELTALALPGEPRLDHHLPALLTEGLYHPDGQQFDEVFVDGSFRQSRMYAMGVACTDCHDPHTGKPRAAGNALCLQCHAGDGDARFPTAAGIYDSPAHHHHPAGSPGAQCTSCHMPAKTYMQIQPRPDHSLRIPRPDLSVTLGTPNACNQCHADRSAAWAAEQVTAWYGPNRRRESHYGTTFAAARAGRPTAADELEQLTADAQQPPIVRATALDALRAYPGTAVNARRLAARDPDPEIRAAAAASLESAAPEERLQVLAPLLQDPIRAVRIAAARALADVPTESLTRDQRTAYNAALEEYVTAQRTALDMPGPRLNLAVVYERLGRPSLAEAEYLAALRIDPDFTPARANLAVLYNRLSRNADAERVLIEGLAREPDIGELQYSLGLVLAEQGRLEEASVPLARAAELLPERARVHYNLGLALQQLGRFAEAETALRQGHAADANDPAIPYALAILFAQTGRNPEAREWAERARLLAPDDPQITLLVDRLRGV